MKINVKSLRARQPRAKGRPKTSRLNRLERSFAEYLTLQQAAGQVAWWRFEAIRLRLGEADGSTRAVFYTPDFLVMRPDGALEVYETKGHWREAAKLRIEVAASMFPFPFFAVYADRRQSSGFRIEAVDPSDQDAPGN